MPLTEARCCQDGRLRRGGEPRLGGVVGELTVAQDRLLLKAGQWKGALPQDFPAREGVEAIWDGPGDSLESCGLFSPSTPFSKELLCSFVTQADHSTMPIIPTEDPLYLCLTGMLWMDAGGLRLHQRLSWVGHGSVTVRGRWGC